MVDLENRRKAILVLKSRVLSVVQMFALAQDWFMVFPALARLVIFTAEHVYSGNPGDRFSAQGVISYNGLPIYNWYEAAWVYTKHGVYSKQYSLAKRAENIGYYLVFKTYVGCFSSKSMVSAWFVSYLLVYTWHNPLHYPHAANAGRVLAGVAPVVLPMMPAPWSAGLTLTTPAQGGSPPHDACFPVSWPHTHHPIIRPIWVLDARMLKTIPAAIKLT